MILKQMIVGSMGVCCYIVACERTGKAAVIDPGGDENKILKEIAARNLTVDAIIATHGHPDHVCGNRRIKEATGARIIMHREDSRFFGRPEVGEYFAMLGMEPSPPVDEEVEDGDIITVGEVQLKVIHTPGHTPGGMCLYCAPDLITGDTLFVGGVGRTDFPGAPPSSSSPRSPTGSSSCRKRQWSGPATAMAAAARPSVARKKATPISDPVKPAPASPTLL